MECTVKTRGTEGCVLHFNDSLFGPSRKDKGGPKRVLSSGVLSLLVGWLGAFYNMSLTLVHFLILNFHSTGYLDGVRR
jgi:hypothetical protein